MIWLTLLCWDKFSLKLTYTQSAYDLRYEGFYHTVFQSLRYSSIIAMCTCLFKKNGGMEERWYVSEWRNGDVYVDAWRYVWEIIIVLADVVLTHDDAIKGKYFPRYWPFLQGIHRSQRQGTRSLDVFFDLRLNKRLSKQSRGWWFGRHLAHCDVTVMSYYGNRSSIQRTNCGRYIYILCLCNYKSSAVAKTTLSLCVFRLPISISMHVEYCTSFCCPHQIGKNSH